MSNRVLLFIVNVDWFFLSHRLVIAKAACAAGFDVHVACQSTGRMRELQAAGLSVHEIRLDRGTTRIGGQIRTIRDIAAVIRQIRPDIVHCITIKPILFGGTIARIMRVPLVVAAISGLGYVFISQGFIATARRIVVGLIYRVALSSKRARVIFQNEDDRNLVSQIAKVDLARTRMIYGSGVDLHLFRASDLPHGQFVVVFAARLLIDKGIREFVDAARSLRLAEIDARFVVAGSRDPENPACIPASELAQWAAEGIIEFVGHVDDIPRLYTTAHVVVLPSYREGMPRSLIEAGAIGRAIITTDVPGCRDAIIPAVSGLLVPVRDSQAVAQAITRLAKNRELCANMGRQGTLFAARKFSIDHVVAQHLEIYAEVLQ